MFKSGLLQISNMSLRSLELQNIQNITYRILPFKYQRERKNKEIQHKRSLFFFFFLIQRNISVIQLVEMFSTSCVLSEMHGQTRLCQRSSHSQHPVSSSESPGKSARTRQACAVIFLEQSSHHPQLKCFPCLQ